MTRLLQTFAGVFPCPPGKNSYARHFKGLSKANYISLESLISVDFGKNMNYQFFNSTKENSKNDRENDPVSSWQTNELIGCQNSADLCEIWPEHSLDVVKQKFVGDF